MTEYTQKEEDPPMNESCPLCSGSGTVTPGQLHPPDAMGGDRDRAVCGRCGMRRMCRFYVWGLPGYGLYLCSECDPWKGNLSASGRVTP